MDGLHRLAGSERMVELHGHLYTTRCSGCERPPFEGRSEGGERLVFLAVGTSGAVWPAAGLVGAAKEVGGET